MKELTFVGTLHTPLLNADGELIFLLTAEMEEAIALVGGTCAKAVWFDHETGDNAWAVYR